ncbi:response regulator receiver domain [Psychroserpens sp. NJDZ02]|uniref:response regulator receiver domain n=1 Tax=Psychroserpens sp. NJDZ02 TaxID=2570561 RepID=UPI0010A94237|nr:response regulator receiver domain [Psychroserpens sp. NJDZ02]QCE41564.1 hypothetical protein E9099_09070 [Psychroserpens sp. NJDZ02]
MTLNQKTKEIILDSIKSAIFIDEKALEPYKVKPRNPYPEVDLSINLLKKFKEKGISLAVHKFSPSDLQNEERLKYFFKRRDLVLLDWRLDGNDGEEHSLNLLSKIVKEKHIHFCSIFTSEHNKNVIIDNLSTYFSGYNLGYYQNIIDELDIYRDDNLASFNQISFNDDKFNGTLFNAFRLIDAGLPKLIKDCTGITSFGEALIQVRYAFSNLHKSLEPNPKLSHINRTNFSLNINNTIITIIPKSENSAIKILNRLVDQVRKSENNLSQLLGLDMQNSFTNNASFIDENLLNTSINTLMYHRKQLKVHNLDLEFNNFIKSILLEHSKLKLEDSDLKILEEKFLNKISKQNYKVSDNEIAVLNAFYNGTTLKEKKILNFGDIFKGENNTYYLCITALCDCILHNGESNIDFNYYFVKGNSIPVEEGIKKGDGGFISYIDSTTCILWGQEYVKPKQFFVENPLLVNNKIRIEFRDKRRVLVKKDIEYVFTLKQNYAQRITNHSFNHPIRVGVDFVKT